MSQRDHGDAVTEVVLLTPPGRGAIATLVVVGPQAAANVVGFLHTLGSRPVAELPPLEPRALRWGGPRGETVLVCVRAADEVHIHCHGGAAAVAAIMADLVRCGARRGDWQAWVRRHETDPIRADARIALAQARTEQVAAVLLDQFHGALTRELAQIERLLATDDREQAARRLGKLATSAPLGLHLTRPWRIVLAGRPNVGKSTLGNALVGYQRSIVSAQPGTTRDVVTASTAIGGWPVELSDTAGLREPGELLEAAGIEQSRSALAAADRVVLVLDASQAWTSEDQALCDALPGALRVHNKCDLLPDPSRIPAGRPAGLAVSARTGQGIDQLVHEIAATLLPQPPVPGTAVVFCAEHAELIKAALQALQAGQLDLAQAAVAQLAATGGAAM